MGHRMMRALAAAALLALFGAPAWAQGYSPTGACPTHQWNDAYGSMTTAADCLQPGFGDMSGTVSNSQLATMGAFTLKGNNTSSTASPSDISVGAWTSYTPTLTCSSGAVSSAATSGRYQQIGKTVHIWLSVDITSLGTCGTNFYVTVPSTNPQSETPLYGYDGTAAGLANVVTSTTGIIVFVVSPAAHQYYAAGAYEAQ